MKTLRNTGNTRPFSSLRPTAASPLIILAILISTSILPQARAEVDFQLTITHVGNGYYAWASLLATNPAPGTYHRVESPGGEIFRNIGSSNSQDSSPFTNSLEAALGFITNGNWSLTLNAGSPTQEVYAFSIDATGLDTNLFEDATILSPLYSETVPTDQPEILWSGPTSFPSVSVTAYEETAPFTFSYVTGTVLPGTATNWTPGVSLPAGNTLVSVSYTSNNVPDIMVSTPTNLAGGAPLPLWNGRANLRNTDSVEFTVPGAGPGADIDDALEMPGLSWMTGGFAGWFVQSNETYFTDSAIQSGPVPDYESSYLETTVEGPGTLIFNWNLLADDDDYFSLTISNQFYEGEEFGVYGYDAFGWDYYEVYLEPGPNTLRWTFDNEDDTGESMDAAFLDWVEYFPVIDYETEFSLEIQRVIRGTNEHYVMFPRLNNTFPPAVTEHFVASPSWSSTGGEGTSSSQQYATLQDLLTEIEDGEWTLIFNIDGPGGREYYFTVSTNTISTNDFPPVVILEPMDGAAGVATNSNYSWIGPPDFDSLQVSARDMDPSVSLGFEVLDPLFDTTWPGGPALPEGTNSFTAIYTSNNFPGLTISEPMDYDYYNLTSWSESVSISTRGDSVFEVTAGFVPVPVSIFPPMIMGGNLGLSFISQPGATHIVEYTTNLITGPWMPATNFPGDGATNMLTLPISDPEAFFRILGSEVATDSAEYRLTFNSTWSAATHPTNFPSPNEHYSSLVGGTHNSGVAFWEPGSLATPGIKRMAETGATSTLKSEVNASISAGNAEFVLSGGGLGSSPGSVEMTFTVTQSHPLATVVSMIAPSPDWFIGVHGANLFVNGAWAEELVIPLQPYDAGTDDGSTYTASNAASSPPQAIQQITGFPLENGGSVAPFGTFTFTRIN